MPYDQVNNTHIATYEIPSWLSLLIPSILLDHTVAQPIFYTQSQHQKALIKALAYHHSLFNPSNFSSHQSLIVFFLTLLHISPSFSHLLVDSAVTLNIRSLNYIVVFTTRAASLVTLPFLDHRQSPPPALSTPSSQPTPSKHIVESLWNPRLDFHKCLKPFDLATLDKPGQPITNRLSRHTR